MVHECRSLLCSPGVSILTTVTARSFPTVGPGRVRTCTFPHDLVLLRPLLLDVLLELLLNVERPRMGQGVVEAGLAACEQFRIENSIFV